MYAAEEGVTVAAHQQWCFAKSSFPFLAATFASTGRRNRHHLFLSSYFPFSSLTFRSLPLFHALCFFTAESLHTTASRERKQGTVPSILRKLDASCAIKCFSSSVYRFYAPVP
jgi:hypothetical protein